MIAKPSPRNPERPTGPDAVTERHGLSPGSHQISPTHMFLSLKVFTDLSFVTSFPAAVSASVPLVFADAAGPLIPTVPSTRNSPANRSGQDIAPRGSHRFWLLQLTKRALTRDTELSFQVGIYYVLAHYPSPEAYR
jgi:hypothetical protein